MKSFYLSLMTFFAFATSMMAEGKNLVITFDNGTTQTYLLSNEPVVTVANDKLVVTMSGTATEYTLNTVKTFTFAVATGIDDIKANGDAQILGDRLLVSGANKVEAYTIDGKKLSVDYIKKGDDVVVNLNSLPKGISIVKVGGKSFKFTKQ